MAAHLSTRKESTDPNARKWKYPLANPRFLLALTNSSMICLWKVKAGHHLPIWRKEMPGPAHHLVLDPFCHTSALAFSQTGLHSGHITPLNTTFGKPLAKLSSLRLPLLRCQDGVVSLVLRSGWWSIAAFQMCCMSTTLPVELPSQWKRLFTVPNFLGSNCRDGLHLRVHIRGRYKRGARGAPRGARAVHWFSTCAYNLFFPLVLFSAPHHYLPLPCGEPVCRGCGIGRPQPPLVRRMEWRPPLLCAYPLGHRVLATLKKCEKCRKGLVET